MVKPKKEMSMDDIPVFLGTISTIPIQLTFGEQKKKIVILFSSTFFVWVS